MRQEIRDWQAELRQLNERIGKYFKRAEPRERAKRYVEGLLGEVRRKNGWQLAEYAGERCPDGMQRLLTRAVWDMEGVRDEVRQYVSERLGTEDGVLILDETGFLKKGEQSVGVKRQYSGTAGGIENCQMGVFLAYAGEQGHALIDSRLYLPKDWCADKARRQAAGIPKDIAFATKPQLGLEMLKQAVTAGVPHRWVTADTIYGDDRALRAWLEARREWYVMGVTRDALLFYEGYRQRFDEIAASLPLERWQYLSCGSGTKGERMYDWALVSWQSADYPPDTLHAFLVRRSLTDPTDEAYFRVFAPADTPLQTLVQVAGRRWAIEECFEFAKGQLGMDQYEVRLWPAWHRHIVLSMLALAFLAVTRFLSRSHPSKKRLLYRPCSFPFRFPKFGGCWSVLGDVSLPCAVPYIGRAGDVCISSVLTSPTNVVNNAFFPICGCRARLF